MKSIVSQIKKDIDLLLKQKNKLQTQFEEELFSLTEQLQNKDNLSTQAYVNLQQKKVALTTQYEQELIEIIKNLKLKKAEYVEQKIQKSYKKIEGRKK